MKDYYPQEILTIAVGKGIEKTEMPLGKIGILSFLGGAYIALGYLAYIRVSGNLPIEWGGIPHLLGASVFPIGLILLLLGGGELITGNMMAVGAAWFSKRITFKSLLVNWLNVSIFNCLGALFIAYTFGHFLGLTEGIFIVKTISTAGAKVDTSFLEAFVSGIGCNWLVGLAVWLCFGAKDYVGKILVIWFPIMIFVLIGFQHVVANFFIIPAAIFIGNLSWYDFILNIIPVWLGNAVGGALFVGGFYVIAYGEKDAKIQEGINERKSVLVGEKDDSKVS